MKLLQKDYPMMSQLEVQLTQEKEMEKLPNRPSKCMGSLPMALVTTPCRTYVSGCFFTTVFGLFYHFVLFPCTRRSSQWCTSPYSWKSSAASPRFGDGMHLLNLTLLVHFQLCLSVVE